VGGIQPLCSGLKGRRVEHENPLAPHGLRAHNYVLCVFPMPIFPSLG